MDKMTSEHVEDMKDEQQAHLDVDAQNDGEQVSPSSEDATDEMDECAQIKAQALEYQDKFLRLQAEWDNFRKRSAQEAEKTRIRASEKLIEALLPVIDDLERALDHAQQSEPADEFKAFVEGISAVHSKFVETLVHKAQLQVIDPLGETFDALKHQAVATAEDTEAYEDTVCAVYQKGYELGGYVLRPAMVSITTGGPQRQSE